MKMNKKLLLLFAGLLLTTQLSLAVSVSIRNESGVEIKVGKDGGKLSTTLSPGESASLYVAATVVFKYAPSPYRYSSVPILLGGTMAIRKGGKYRYKVDGPFGFWVKFSAAR